LREVQAHVESGLEGGHIEFHDVAHLCDFIRSICRFERQDVKMRENGNTWVDFSASSSDALYPDSVMVQVKLSSKGVHGSTIFGMYIMRDSGCLYFLFIDPDWVSDFLSAESRQ
jgi:hypothetical protein